MHLHIDQDALRAVHLVRLDGEIRSGSRRWCEEQAAAAGIEQPEIVRLVDVLDDPRWQR